MNTRNEDGDEPAYFRFHLAAEMHARASASLERFQVLAADVLCDLRRAKDLEAYWYEQATDAARDAALELERGHALACAGCGVCEHCIASLPAPNTSPCSSSAPRGRGELVSCGPSRV